MAYTYSRCPSKRTPAWGRRGYSCIQTPGGRLDCVQTFYRAWQRSLAPGTHFRPILETVSCCYTRQTVLALIRP